MRGGVGRGDRVHPAWGIAAVNPTKERIVNGIGDGIGYCSSGEPRWLAMLRHDYPIREKVIDIVIIQK